MASNSTDVDINLNIKADNSLKSVREMRLEIRAMNDEMQAAGAAGDKVKFDSFKQEIGELKKGMKDLNQEMKFSSNEMFLSGMAKMAKGVVGSFGVAKGAMELFGASTEKAVEAQKDMAVVIETLMSLEEVRELLEGKGMIKGLMATAARITGLQAEVVATQFVIAADAEATVAQTIWNAAMAAMPLFAIIAGVAALVGGIYLLVNAFKTETIATRESAVDMKEYSEFTVKILKEITKARIEYLYSIGKISESVYKSSLTYLSKQDEYEAVLQQNKINRSKALAEHEDRVAKIRKNGGKDQMRNLLDEEGDYELSLQDIKIAGDEKLHNINTKYQLIDMREKAEIKKKEKEEQVKAQEEKQKSYEESLNKINDYFRKNFKTTMTERNKEISEEDNAYQKSLALTKDNSNLKEAVNEAHRIKLFNINKKYDKIDQDNQDALDDSIIKEQQTIIDAENKKNEDARKKSLEDDIKFDAERITLLQNYHDQVLSLGNTQDQIELESIEKKKNEELRINSEMYASFLIDEATFNKNKQTIIDKATEKSTKTKIDALVKDAKEILNFADATGNLMQQIYAGQEQDLAKHQQTESDIQQQAQSDATDALSLHYDNLISIATASGQSTTALEAKKTKALKDLATKQAADDKALKEKQALESKELKKKEAIIDFTIASAKIIVSTAEAIASHLETPWMIPFDVATGIIEEAAVAVQLANVEKMALGGLISGPSHSAGGVTRELEGGEAVVNKNSMAVPAFRNIVSKINQVGGGVSFNPGSGSNSDASLTATLNSSDLDAIVSRIASIPVIVTEYDISRMQRKVQVIQQRSIIG